ncbi:STAS domain-containing protein [Nonomuraea insulae]|uniref:STAS domain-containing protein n=1 Tax=Nonomuraea insulae TaxID=1616787 RepID=A0ABW1CR20_9ACTN
MMQFSVRLVPVGETTLVLALTGELDLTTRPVLADFLDPIPRSPVTYVVVAAGDLWFCDVNGLHQLVLTHRALQAKGGHLAVAEARPPLQRLLDLMARHDTLPAIAAYTSMAEALAATDVETCQIDGPPVPMPRHLPRLRGLRSVHTAARHPREARPRRKPVDQSSAATITRSRALIVRSQALIVQSRALGEHAAGHRQVSTARLSEAHETVRRLGDTRRRCDDSLTALRATLLNARAAMDARATSLNPLKGLNPSGRVGAPPCHVPPHHGTLRTMTGWGTPVTLLMPRRTNRCRGLASGT